MARKYPHDDWERGQLTKMLDQAFDQWGEKQEKVWAYQKS
jgi:hypothetical protein